MYTHDSKIITEAGDDDLKEIMETADFIQCQEIIRECFNHVNEYPTVNSLVLAARYCGQYPHEVTGRDAIVDDYHDAYRTVLCNHYLELIRHPDMLELDGDQMYGFWNPTCAVNKEWHLDIFRLIVNWIKCSPKNRSYLRSVFFNKIKLHDLRLEVLPALKELPDFQDLVENVQEFVDNEYLQPILAVKFPYGNLMDLRLSNNGVHTLPFFPNYFGKAVMYVFGGGPHSPDMSDSDCMAFSTDVYIENKEVAGVLKEDSYISAFKRGKRSVGYWPLKLKYDLIEPKGDSIDAYAFIAGGYSLKDNGDKQWGKQFIRYNMNTGETLGLQALPNTFCWHAMVAYKLSDGTQSPKEGSTSLRPSPNFTSAEIWSGGCIDSTASHFEASDVTYIYSVENNCLKPGKPLPKPLCHFAACYTEEKEEGLYVSGGVTKVDPVSGEPNPKSACKALYKYNASTEVWERLPSMRKPRYDHTMKAHANWISEYYDTTSRYGFSEETYHYAYQMYIAGGKGKTGRYITSVEVFSLIDKQWTQINPISFLDGSNMVFLRQEYAALCIFSEGERGENFYHYFDWLGHNEVTCGKTCCLQLPFSVKGSLVLPCLQEMDLQVVGEDDMTLITRQEMCSWTHDDLWKRPSDYTKYW